MPRRVWPAGTGERRQRIVRRGRAGKDSRTTNKVKGESTLKLLRATLSIKTNSTGGNTLETAEETGRRQGRRAEGNHTPVISSKRRICRGKGEREPGREHALGSKHENKCAAHTGSL